MSNLTPNQHCSLMDTQVGADLWVNQEGQFHRVDENGHQDGPAQVYHRTGTQIWYLDGKCHRADANGHQDGPACIYGDGLQEWYLEGKLHRLDGPAVVFPDGTQSWYLDGVWMTQEEWAQDIRVVEFNTRTQLGAESWLKRL